MVYFYLGSLFLLQVKLWDLSNDQPSCVASKNPKAVCDFFIWWTFLVIEIKMGINNVHKIGSIIACVFVQTAVYIYDCVYTEVIVTLSSKCYCQGAVFSISFSEDCPFLLAIGGSKGKLEVSILCAFCSFIQLILFFFATFLVIEGINFLYHNAALGYNIWWWCLAEIREVPQSE